MVDKGIRVVVVVEGGSHSIFTTIELPTLLNPVILCGNPPHNSSIGAPVTPGAHVVARTGTFGPGPGAGPGAGPGGDGITGGFGMDGLDGTGGLGMDGKDTDGGCG